MGLERLLGGTLRCYVKQCQYLNVQQHGFCWAPIPEQSKATVYEVVKQLIGEARLCRGIFAPKHRRDAALTQLAARRSFCTSAQPSRDVTLFEHDRTRFFRLLAFFCGGQFLFWTYLAHFAFNGLRDTGSAKGKAKAATTTTTTSTSAGVAGIWSFEMNLGTNTWRYGFTAGCLAIGASILGLGVLFCRRSVSRVILHKGGRMVTVSTQSPLGAGQSHRITVPLSQVACHAHRQESPSFIPLRVKGHKFYFLLDKEGTINNARLFDITVGAYRSV